MKLGTIRSRLSLGVVGIALVIGGCAPIATSLPPSPEVTGTVPVSPSFTDEVFTATSLPSATPLPILTPLPGPTATLAAVKRSSYASDGGCDRSAFVGDVTIPDGTVLAPGATFTKTWEVRNTGNCAWTQAYAITFFGGEQMGGLDTDLARIVRPGETAEISVSLKAPNTPGTYIGYWILANKAGTRFGERIYVQIVVSG